MAAWAWLKTNQRDIVQGAAIAFVVLTLPMLNDSVGPAQREAAQPMARAVRVAEGRVTPALINRISMSLSPYARHAAERLLKGEEWTPVGPEGMRGSDFTRAPTLLQRNLSFEEARAFNALVPAFEGAVPALKPFILPAKAGVERERAELCLTQAVYYEAGFESGEGQQAVAQVILNRLRHPAYPKSVCGVVYQGSQRTTGCQFSFTCDGSLARAPSAVAWERSRYVARTALNGFVFKPVGTSTHYHADYVFPYWAVTLVKLRQIGAHIFYRMTGPAGTVAAFDGQYAGGEMALSAAVLQGGDARTPDAPSVVKAAPATPAQTMTITLGGETKTYIVGPAQSLPGLPPGQVGATPPGVAISGTIGPARRTPTVAEMADINERIRQLEEKQAAERAAGKSGLPGDK